MKKPPRTAGTPWARRLRETLAKRRMAGAAEGIIIAIIMIAHIAANQPSSRGLQARAGAIGIDMPAGPGRLAIFPR